MIAHNTRLRPSKNVCYAFGLSPKMLIISTAGSALASPAITVSSSTPLPKRKRQKTTYYREEFKEAFLKLQYCAAGDERTVLAPRANSSPSEDYTDVFLSHARVYVFAEKFDIQPLKRMAMKVLHQTLSIFTLWPECLEDIVALVRFVYSETSKPAHGGEPMRSLLMRYISYEMDVLIGAVGFRDLLEENRDFLDNFCSYVKRRLID